MHLTRILSTTAFTMLFCAGFVSAQENGALVRAQWVKQVGDSAKNASTLSDTIKQVAPDERVEFTQKVLKAATKMPLDSDSKATRYIESAIHCVANTTLEDETKYGAIAESIALSPVPILPALVKELSKRFDPSLKVNNLTNERYREIAEKGVQVCFKRNASVDDTRIRNTFAILLFTRAAPNMPELQDILLAKLPDDRSRELAIAWLADAARDDYTAILAAAEAPVLPPNPAINMVGHPQTARLLTYTTLTDSMFDALTIASTGTSLDRIDIQIDAGFEQTPKEPPPKDEPPKGYQNQGTSLTRPCWCWDIPNGRRP